MTQPEHFTIPHPLLQPYVTAFMNMKLNVAGSGFVVDLFPVGTGVISYALKDVQYGFLGKHGPTPRFNLAGQLTRYHKLSIQGGNYSHVYAVLKPYGIYRLFHFPQNTITDGYISVNKLLGDKVTAVCASFDANADEPATVIKLMEEWMLHQFQLHPHPAKMDEVMLACKLIEESDGSKNIEDICKEVGMSKSSIERHFLEKIGISPKMYSRIVRCTNAYNTIQSGKYRNWQDVVYQYNFYDQAHFIKDFKGFFNRTPAEVYHNSLNSADILRKQ